MPRHTEEEEKKNKDRKIAEEQLAKAPQPKLQTDLPQPKEETVKEETVKEKTGAELEFERETGRRFLDPDLSPSQLAFQLEEKAAGRPSILGGSDPFQEQITIQQAQQEQQ